MSFTPMTVGSNSMNFAGIPSAFHVGSDEVPFAENFGAPGVHLKLLFADPEGGVFVVRIRFEPGVQLPPHHHTGAVYAFTLKGEWSYLEYPETPPNKAGSFLYEPAGSTHTLKVADHAAETDVFYVIHGAMLIQDPAGNIVARLDAASHLRDWPDALRAQGKKVPQIVTGGRAHYVKAG
jgi:2,4'-dihydroxyacetophenone dioxygenase